MPAPLVDATDAARRHVSGEATLLDVREPFELALASVAGALHIPMREVPARLGDIPQGKPVLVLCHSGARSQVVADWLAARGFEAANVAGGIDAWSASVDAHVPRY